MEYIDLEHKSQTDFNSYKNSNYFNLMRRLSLSSKENIVHSPLAKKLLLNKPSKLNGDQSLGDEVITDGFAEESNADGIFFESEQKIEIYSQRVHTNPTSNGPQDINLEPTRSIPFSFGLRSPGKSSPLRGRNMKEYEEQFEHLKKENFALKLRIYFLEEKFGHKGIKEDKEELHKANIELKVETEALKKQLCDKQDLLRQAAALVTNFEDQFKEELRAVQETHERDTQKLEATNSLLQKKLDEYAEKLQQEDGSDLTQLCGLAFSNAADDEYRRPSHEKTLSNNPILSPTTLKGVFSMQDHSKHEERPSYALKNSCLSSQNELIPDSAKNKINELEEEVERLNTKVADLQNTLRSKERTSQALQEDIDNLKREIEERDDRMSDLEQEVNEKDQKVDQLMQELETRHLEIAAKDSTIQTLHDDLNKVEPQIEVKVQEIIEKDRIIEEKKEQLQQQNKILVEIQITLDEKQKQIAELEESLLEARTKVEKLNKEFDFSLGTIKELTAELVTRNAEILQLKKELKKKEKKVKDLLAELKEALDMLKKAKWEAETNGGQDGVKEMVEEENERLWAELEQRKLELTQMREDKQKLTNDLENKELMLKKEKEAAEEKLRLLQKQMAKENKGERDKLFGVEQVSFIEKKEARESLLKSQEVIIEALKSDLATTKGELLERKQELKELKGELSRRNNDMQELYSKELFGRNKELHELHSKFCSIPMGQGNPLEALKLFMESNQMKLNSHASQAKESQQVQVRSNSLSRLSEPLTKPSGKENTPSQTSKAGRSNSFSLLENLLYANMGQKVYNTNQTFNTYVLSSDAEGKQGEIIPLNEDGSSIPTSALKVEVDGHENIKSKVLLASILCREAQKVSGKSSSAPSKGIKSSTLTNKGDVELEICSIPETRTGEENELEYLYEEMNNIRNEAQAIRKDREVLIEKVSALQALNEQLSQASDRPTYEHEAEVKQSKRSNDVDDFAVSEIQGQIETMKLDLKGTKQRVTLQMLQVASTKYKESLKYYKQEIISLRKRLTDSHNTCDLLRNRLEELVDFFEHILEMDKKGIINLSHLSSAQRSSLRKSLEDSRSLSLSLSNSLMIGTDSILGESNASINDEEASRFCLPFDNLTEELDFSRLREFSVTEDRSNAELTNDFMYYSFASKINSQIDDKTKQFDKFVSKLTHFSKLLEVKDEQIKFETDNVKYLQGQIIELKEKMHLKNRLLTESQLDAAEQLLNSNDDKSTTNSSLHLSALQHSMSLNIDSNIHDGLFIVPGESSSSDTLPPPPPHFNSQGEETSFVSAEKTRISQSDVGSAYSTDVVVKNLPTHVSSNLVTKTHHESYLPGMTLEEPGLPPTFALASPSESEAWSEPDRNVSLARIGLETCNLISISHDRSLSRSRMTRSAPFTSESEGEGNQEEVKEGSVGLGTPSTKPKRRSDAAEVKRLTAKLKTVEQLNETLRAELHIYQTLNHQFNSTIEREPNYQVIYDFPLKTPTDEKFFGKSIKDSEEPNQQYDNDSNCSFTVPSSLLQEIRSLRMKLEEAIANNDLLRDQLEAALSGYLSEESRNLTTKLAFIQQELKTNQEKLLMAANTEHQLRMQIKDHETKMFELGERLADYITLNQKFEQRINDMNHDLQRSKDLLGKSEKELKDMRSLNEEKELAQKELQYSKTLQMEVDVNTLKIEIKKLQQSEKDKDRKVEEQRKYIVGLEEAKDNYEFKLVEKESAIKELCESIKTLEQESSKSSGYDHLVSKLQEVHQNLQHSEEHLIQITKERFALLGENARLQAQLASVTTHANLLQGEVRELSVSEDPTGSDVGVQHASQKLQEAQKTIQELLQCKELYQSEKQGLKKEIELMQEEISVLRSHIDHVLSKESINHSREIQEVSDLQLSYRSLKEKYVTLEKIYQNALSDKTCLENRLKDLQEKEMSQLKSTLMEAEAKRKELISQLDAERCLTNNLQIQIKNLQFTSFYSNVPSDKESRLTSEANRPSNRTSLSKNISSPFKESSSALSWNDNKENQLPHYSSFPRGTLSLPNIEDDATSGDYPDLGIGSDGQFSSLERLSSSTSTTTTTRVLKAGLNQRFYTIESEKEERINKLCSDPSHSRLLWENGRLREECEDLGAKLATSKESLKDALSQLMNANQKKESVERAICKQLTKTHAVLRQAKGNLRHAKGKNELQQIQSTKDQPQKG